MATTWTPVPTRRIAHLLLGGEESAELDAIDRAWLLKSKDEAKGHLEAAAAAHDVALVRAVLVRMLFQGWLDMVTNA